MIVDAKIDNGDTVQFENPMLPTDEEDEDVTTTTE